MTLWNLIVYLAVGALVGWAAGKIMKSKGGLLRNMIVGIVGSALGGWVADLIGLGRGSVLSVGGMLIAIGGACLLIILCRMVLGKK